MALSVAFLLLLLLHDVAIASKLQAKSGRTIDGSTRSMDMASPSGDRDDHKTQRGKVIGDCRGEQTLYKLESSK
jgi:hypothetical protein